jgi:hypothetical protein
MLKNQISHFFVWLTTAMMLMGILAGHFARSKEDGAIEHRIH